MIRYVEHATRSKFTDGTGNEDRLFLGETLCAVIDGATAKLGQAAHRGARVVALIAGALEHIDAAAAMQAGTTPPPDAQALVAQITAHVRAELAAELADAADARPSAAVVIYLAARRQVIRVGDCHLAINGQAHRGTKAVDTLLAEVRSLYLRMSQVAGAPAAGADTGLGADDPGRAVILPVLIRQAALQNRADLPPYGYGCIDGTDVPAAFIEVWDTPPGAEVVLCSDGYLNPAPTLARAEAELAAALATDPYCIGVLKGTKGLRAGQISFDDRSYLRFRTG